MPTERSKSLRRVFFWGQGSAKGNLPKILRVALLRPLKESLALRQFYPLFALGLLLSLAESLSIYPLFALCQFYPLFAFGLLLSLSESPSIYPLFALCQFYPLFALRLCLCLSLSVNFTLSLLSVARSPSLHPLFASPSLSQALRQCYPLFALRLCMVYLSRSVNLPSLRSSTFYPPPGLCA